MRARQVVVGIVVAAVGVLGLLPASASAAAADTTPPVLRSVSFSEAQAQPGQRLSATVDAADDGVVATVALVLYEQSSGQSGTWRSTTPTQPITLAVGTNWANGDWRVQRVVLFDAAGNRAVYSFDGRLDTTPATTTTHGVDLLGPAFAVSGATDWSPPVLTGLTPVPATSGDPRTVGFTWEIDTRGRDIHWLSTTWVSAEDPANQFVDTVQNPTASGTASVTLPRGGRWHLRSVLLYWATWTTYYDTGELQRWQGAPTVPHDLDFDAFDRVVAPGAPTVSVVARATRISTYVDTTPARAEGLTGYRVAVQPANVSRVVPVSQAGTDGKLLVDIAGLPNGVEQTVSVAALGGYGNSPTTTRRARPVLASTIAAMPSQPWASSDLVATRPFGTTKDTSVLGYESSGRGRLRGPYLFRQNSEAYNPCRALVAFSLRDDRSQTPLCQEDSLVPLDYRGTPPVIGARGWSGMRFVDGGFDLNGDRTADIIAVDPAGDLRFYAQTSKGNLLAWPRVGTGWGSMISVLSAGDLTGDRKNDVAAVDASGRLWLYPGNGKGGVTARKQIGSGWHQMGALLPLRDFDGDGRTDLGGITPAGDLRLYRGTGTGGVRNGVVIGTGWDRYL